MSSLFIIDHWLKQLPSDLCWIISPHKCHRQTNHCVFIQISYFQAILLRAGQHGRYQNYSELCLNDSKGYNFLEQRNQIPALRQHQPGHSGARSGPLLRCHEITDGISLVMMVMGWGLHQTLWSLSFVLIIISGLDGDSAVLKKLHCEQLRCEDIKGTINVWVMWTQCLGGLTNKTWIERLNITEMRDGQITWSINNSNNNNRNDPLQSHQCVAIGCIMLMPGQWQWR